MRFLHATGQGSRQRLLPHDGTRNAVPAGTTFIPDGTCHGLADTPVIRSRFLQTGALLPVTRPPVSCDMDVTELAPITVPSGSVLRSVGPGSDNLPPRSDTPVTDDVTDATTNDVTEVAAASSRNVDGKPPTTRYAVPERVAAIWSLERVAAHYGTSTRTIRRWLKDPAKAPVRLHALAGEDGKEAVPLQVTGDLPPLRKSWQDEPEGPGETDTTAIIQAPREADLIEIIGDLSQELHQQYREQISRLIVERDAERTARLEAEIRAALAEDRAVRLKDALDEATTATRPILVPPPEAPRTGRLAHLWEAIRLG